MSDFVAYDCGGNECTNERYYLSCIIQESYEGSNPTGKVVLSDLNTFLKSRGVGIVVDVESDDYFGILYKFRLKILRGFYKWLN